MSRLNFTNYSSLVGGAGNYVFSFSPEAKLSGNANGGGGSNTVDVSSTTASNITVNLATGNVSAAVGGNYFVSALSIQSFVGNGASGSAIVGPNTAGVFNITGTNAGSVGGVNFTGFGTLAGGSGGNSFVFSGAGSITGSLNGGSGTNTIDESALNKTVAANLAGNTITGVGSTFSNVQNIIGSTTNYGILGGPSASSTYNITGSNAIAVGGVNFSNYSSIVAVGNTKVFMFSNGAKVAGGINGGGGGGGNWLDFSGYTTGVNVDLATGTSTGVGGGGAGALMNIQNVRGGSGNHTLTGNSSGNILIGGGGTNTITGGSGVSLLIAGAGQSTITGGSGGEIIISGYTVYDNNNTALDAILAEWKSTDTYANRVNFIKNGGGLNEAYKFNLGTTVVDNLASNILTGASGGKNWYFKGSKTTITNLKSGEMVN